MFVPYKYTIDNQSSTLTVATRSENNERKLFKYQIESRIIYEVSGSIGSIGEILDILRNILNTNNIHFDENINKFISYGKLEIPNDIKHFFKSIVSVPLKTSSALQCLGRRFFEKINDDGSTNNERASSTTYKYIVWNIEIEIPPTSSNPSSIRNPITIINFVTSDKEAINTWSILSSVEGVLYDNEKIMLESFYNLILEYDVDVTFSRKVWDYYLSRLGLTKNVNIKEYWDIFGYTSYKEYNIITLEHIYLSELSDFIHSDLSDHSFVALSKELLDKNVIELDHEEMRILTFADINKSTNRDQKLKWKSIKGYMSVNIDILHKLYLYFAPMITMLSFSSGCNFSELSNVNLYKDILGYINPSIVDNDIIPIIPKKYLRKGIYTNVYVIPIGPYLQSNLMSASHKLTREIGFSLSNLTKYDWIIEKIFQLDGLVPNDCKDFFSQTSEIGIYDGLLYTIEPINDARITKRWTMFIVIGTGNWIGVNKIDDQKFIYSYKGIADICRHPFSAVKLCIELYLSFIIDNVSINIHQVVKNTNLTHETMVMKKYVTIENIESYKNLLTTEQINCLEKLESTYIPLNVYYDRNRKLTINPYESDIETYRNELTRIMKTLPSDS